MPETLAPSVTIRRASEGDVDRLVEMGRHFRDQTVYRNYVGDDPAHMRRLAETVLTMGVIFVA